MKALLCALLLACACTAQAGSEWSVPWYSVDAGGLINTAAVTDLAGQDKPAIASAGGAWQLSGTVGQPDATSTNAHSGGAWALTGGFWSWLAKYVDSLFSDRFEG